MAMLNVYIIRHGETHYNRQHRFQGQADTQLNDNGLRQANLLAQRFKDVKIHKVITSDLSRASITAMEILKYHKPGVEVEYFKDFRWREGKYGCLEHLDKKEAILYMKKTNTNWEDHMENPDEYKKRLEDAWNDLLISEVNFINNNPKVYTNKNQNERSVVIVSHGGTINKLCYHHLVLEKNYNYSKIPNITGRIGNTSVTHISIDLNHNIPVELLRGTFHYYADTSHLDAIVLENDD